MNEQELKEKIKTLYEELIEEKKVSICLDRGIEPKNHLLVCGMQRRR